MYSDRDVWFEELYLKFLDVWQGFYLKSYIKITNTYPLPRKKCSKSI